MLNNELIVKGPPRNWDFPDDLDLGEYFLNCLKKRHPDEIFCIDGETNDAITCGQVVTEILKLAHILSGLGIEEGVAIAVIIENCNKFVVLLVAALYLRAPANLLNPGYSTGELKYALNMSKAKVIFCSKTSYKNVLKVSEELNFIKHVILMENVPETEGTNFVNVDSFEALLEGTTIDVQNIKRPRLKRTNDIAAIVLSSGTTGLPKGVMITYNNTKPSIHYMGDPNYLGITSEDSLLCVLPFFHIYGLSTILCAISHSTKLIMLRKFQLETFLSSIETQKATVVCAIPSLVSFLAKHSLAKKYDLSSVKLVVSSGGHLGREIQEECCKVHPHIAIRQTYGLTETTGAVTVMTADRDTNKIGSIGSVISEADAMVWSEELDENVKPTILGELCFRGEMIMKGYIGREDNGIDEHGFYHTGDVGYYDEQGTFYIVGRIKELIKYKGFQVAPAELEDLLLLHPLVKDAAVFGLPDERAGQLASALVVPQSNSSVTEKDIVDFVAERISVQKHLHGGVRFAESIPKNPTGKILRPKLQEIFMSKN